jgi:hypothetical protein
MPSANAIQGPGCKHKESPKSISGTASKLLLYKRALHARSHPHPRYELPQLSTKTYILTRLDRKIPKSVHVHCDVPLESSRKPGEPNKAQCSQSEEPSEAQCSQSYVVR